MLEYDQDEQSKLLYKDFIGHYEGLKINATELYKNKKLSTLKRWFKDISEQAVATRDLNYQKHIEKETGHSIDIFGKFLSRIDKIIQNGIITTTSQYRDIVAMIGYISGDSSNADKVLELDKLIFDYTEKKRSRTKPK